MEIESAHRELASFLKQNTELECDPLKVNGKLMEMESESRSEHAEIISGLTLLQHGETRSTTGLKSLNHTLVATPLSELNPFNHGHNPAGLDLSASTLNSVLSGTILNSDLSETTAEFDLFGCMDNEKEADELLTGLLETEEEVDLGLLDGISLSDVVFDLPSTVYIHEQPNTVPRETSLEHLPSQTATQPTLARTQLQHHPMLTQYNYGQSPYNMPALLFNPQYNTLEQEFILTKHPHLDTLRELLRTKYSGAYHHEIPKGEAGSPSVGLGGLGVEQSHISGTDIIGQNYIRDIDYQEHLCYSAPGISESDRLMKVAVATARDRINGKHFIGQLERVDEDCTTLLSSVSSFCRDLLKTAKENEDDKENTQELTQSSKGLCNKRKKKTKPNIKSEEVVTKASQSSNGLCDTHQVKTKTCVLQSEEQHTVGTDQSCVQGKGSKRKISASQRKKREHISKRSTDILQQWLIEHADHPYPDDDEKEELCLRTDLTLLKLNQWFVNGRRRVLTSVGLHVPKSKR